MPLVYPLLYQHIMKIALSLLTAVALSSHLHAGITVDKSPAGAVVKVDGKVFAEYVMNGEGSNKPYLWPIYGPTGKSMTRAYPMQTVEGEQHDHPHHRGLCFGQEDIAGFDSWAEKATFEEMLRGKNAEKGKARLAALGAQVHREFTELKADGDSATIAVTIDYVDAAGKKLLEEHRRMIFRADAETRTIDVDIDLIASEGPVVSADKKDAGISIRVPTSMAVDTKLGGKLINAEGKTDKDTWGVRSTWCDYHGPVEGETLGVAMLNHPSSFRYPTYWHARTYGLFTANPFGTHSLDPNAPDGAEEIKPGAPLKLRHRFIFHKGDEQTAKIAEAFAAYAKESKD